MDKVIELLVPWLVVILLGLVVLLIFRINTVVHELGHAVAMLALTSGPVTVYLGSYGNREKSFRVRVGRLEIFSRRNVLLWRGGLCQTSAQASSRAQMLYILAGPAASLAVFLLMLLVLYKVSWEGLSAGAAYLACLCTLLSFLFNLVPSKKEIRTADGRVTYTDGTLLWQLWKLRRMPPAFSEALQLYAAGQYEQAGDQLERLIGSGVRSPDAFKYGITALELAGKLQRAEQLYHQFLASGLKLRPEDAIIGVRILVYNDQYQEAIDQGHRMLAGGNHHQALYNIIGYAQTITGQYEQAIVTLNTAIHIDPRFAHAYGNRSFALLMLGRLPEGKADLDLVRALEPGAMHGYDFRNEGIYLLRTGDPAGAKACFETAMARDPEIPGLHDWLQEADAQLTGVSWR